MNWGGWGGTSGEKNNKRTPGIATPQIKKVCFSAVPQTKALCFYRERPYESVKFSFYILSMKVHRHTHRLTMIKIHI